MGSFQESFMLRSVADRQRIATRAGMSLGYLQKHWYTSGGDPRFSLESAIALDEATDGGVCLIETTSGQIDWKYVLKRLRSAERRGEL